MKRKLSNILCMSVVSAAMLADTVAPALAECYAQAPLAPVHRTFVRRDIIEPRVYSVGRVPSLYGWYAKKIYTPGEVVWHETAPVYRTVTAHVKVGGGWTWEKREINGRYVMCRVRLPYQYETVEKRILVSHGHRWVEHLPGTVAYVPQRTLLRPYKNIVYTAHPTIHWYSERVAIQPEGYRWRRVPSRPDC